MKCTFVLSTDKRDNVEEREAHQPPLEIHRYAPRDRETVGSEGIPNHGGSEERIQERMIKEDEREGYE